MLNFYAKHGGTTDARLGTSVESAPAPRRNTGDGTTRTEGAHNLKINYDAVTSGTQAKKLSV